MLYDVPLLENNQNWGGKRTSASYHAASHHLIDDYVPVTSHHQILYLLHIYAEKNLPVTSKHFMLLGAVPFFFQIRSCG